MHKNSILFLFAVVAVLIFVVTGAQAGDWRDRDSRWCDEEDKGRCSHNEVEEVDPAEAFKTCAAVLPATGNTIAGPGYFSSDRGRVYTTDLRLVGNKPAVCITIANLSAEAYVLQGTNGDAKQMPPNNYDVDPMDVRTYCYDSYDSGIYLGCSDDQGNRPADCNVCWRVDRYGD